MMIMMTMTDKSHIEIKRRRIAVPKQCETCRRYYEPGDGFWKWRMGAQGFMNTWCDTCDSCFVDCMTDITHHIEQLPSEFGKVGKPLNYDQMERLHLFRK